GIKSNKGKDNGRYGAQDSLDAIRSKGNPVFWIDKEGSTDNDCQYHTYFDHYHDIAGPSGLLNPSIYQPSDQGDNNSRRKVKYNRHIAYSRCRFIGFQSKLIRNGQSLRT